MTRPFPSLAFALPVLLAIAAGAVWWVRRPCICASLYDLIGEAAEAIPAFVREASSADLAFLVSSENGEKARAVAREIARRHPVCASPNAGALAFVRENRGGLVTPASAVLLATAEGRAQVARKAKRRLYASPLPPILGYADDPFGLTEEFLMTLLPKASTKTSEGYPVLVTNGVTHILLRMQIERQTGDLEKTIATIDSLSKDAATCVAALGFGNAVSVSQTGVSAHTAAAAGRCKREVCALTWLSLAVIALLALFAFRSVRWLPLLTGSLLVSALSGAFALGLLFRELHVLTFVIGTTVLGLVIDYSFHWLLSPVKAKATVVRGLLVSFFTTEVSLLPLMMSSVPVLRQSFTFLGVGLAGALGYVFVAYPRDCGREGVQKARPSRLLPWLRRVLIPVFIIAAAGVFRLNVKTEISALYRPSAELAEAEKLRAQFGTFDVSVLPTLEERQKNAANVAALYKEHGNALKTLLGRETLRPPPEPRELLLRPQAVLEKMFSRWTSEAQNRLMLSIAILVAALFLCCRRKALRFVLPPVGAVLVTAGVLGWMGVPLNLFHLLAVFLLIGMGTDYAVFLSTGDPAAFKPALCSLLTSLVGFGALAFVSFPVVQSFGVILGLGLPLAFVLSCLGGRRNEKSL